MVAAASARILFPTAVLPVKPTCKQNRIWTLHVAAGNALLHEQAVNE